MMKLKLSRNYFSWIGNFGVVPLFAFLIFLLAPAFFLRFILRPFVVFVFETIGSLPFTYDFTNAILRRFRYLHGLFSSVKAFIAIFLAGSLFLSTLLLADENSAGYESIILSKGEHKEINMGPLKKFSVTNHEVISYKHLEDKNKILLKGQKIGFSELIIWKEQNEKLVYRIYVLDKASQLQMLNLAQSLTSAGLIANVEGTSIIATGELSTFFHYDLVMKLIKNNPDKIQPQLTLSKDLKNFIIAEVYFYLMNEYNDDIICTPSRHEIICRYGQANTPSQTILDYLQGKYHIKLIPSNLSLNGKNFKIKMKLIQIEYNNESNLSLGLNQLQGSWSEVFSQGIKALISKNEIILKENDLSLSTLAEPEIILTLDESALVSVGSEVPFKEYRNGNSDASHTSWKFAGLKVILTLKKNGPFYKVEYKTEFTKPSDDGQISGSKEKSNALIKINQPLELFQIGFKTFGKSNGQIPWIGDIPILGNIFRSKSDRATYKKITALVELSQNEI